MAPTTSPQTTRRWLDWPRFFLTPRPPPPPRPHKSNNQAHIAHLKAAWSALDEEVEIEEVFEGENEDCTQDALYEPLEQSSEEPECSSDDDGGGEDKLLDPVLASVFMRGRVTLDSTRIDIPDLEDANEAEPIQLHEHSEDRRYQDNANRMNAPQLHRTLGARHSTAQNGNESSDTARAHSFTSDDTYTEASGVQRQQRPIAWSPSDKGLGAIKCYEIPGTLNGVPVNALPDWGSAVEAVSEDFARRHGLRIEATDTQSIRLIGGHMAESVGRIIGDFEFQGERHAYCQEFHVLRKSVYDVVLGRKFLDKTRTLTDFCHRIVERIRPCIQKGNRLFLLDESPRDHLRCTVNGSQALAFPDTGSELMLISGDFARRNKLTVHRGNEYRRQIELIDGSIVRTDGMVLNAELQFDAPPASTQALENDRYLNFAAGLSSLTGYGAKEAAKATFICDLHVIEDLPCDIILSIEFIFQNQVFSRFKDLFGSRLADISLSSDKILQSSLLFMRNRSTGSTWFSRWRLGLQSDTNTSGSSVVNYGHSAVLTALVHLQESPSWENCWAIEEARRNRAQPWIASLPEPQKSVEQRNEKQRQEIWDKNNPRPPAMHLASPNQVT